MPSDDVPERPKVAREPVVIADWLASIGFESDDARAHARATLEQAGLTNPRKRGMAQEKLTRARTLLDRQLRLLCASCAKNMTRPDKRTVVVTSQPYCTTCAGSNNRRAAEAMIAAFRRTGVGRLLVVGGTSAIHRELQAFVAGTDIDLRCIDGTERQPNRREAQADLKWAEVMVIWASTPLPHKVSTVYTSQCPPEVISLTVRRRGIEALCLEVAERISSR